MRGLQLAGFCTPGLAHHETRDVLQEEQGDAPLPAELHKVRALLCLVRGLSQLSRALRVVPEKPNKCDRMGPLRAC